MEKNYRLFYRRTNWWEWGGLKKVPYGHRAPFYFRNIIQLIAAAERDERFMRAVGIGLGIISTLYFLFRFDFGGYFCDSILRLSHRRHSQSSSRFICRALPPRRSTIDRLLLLLLTDSSPAFGPPIWRPSQRSCQSEKQNKQQ